MMLQSAGRAFEGDRLEGKDVYEVSGRVSEGVMKGIWERIKKGEAEEAAEEVVAEGYDVMQVLAQLMEVVVKERGVTDLHKARVAEVCASTEGKLIRGGSEELNLIYMFMNISKIIKA